MFTTILSEAAPAEVSSPEASAVLPPASLPGFSRLAGAACAAGGLPVALLLLTGRLWPAVSVALGVGISLGVCGLLFLFVERLMPAVFGVTRSGAGGAAAPGSQVQFLVLSAAKLALIALLGAAFLTLHQINLMAVALGFALGQGAVVVSASRFRRPK